MRFSIGKFGALAILFLAAALGCDKRGEMFENEGIDAPRHAGQDDARPGRADRDDAQNAARDAKGDDDENADRDVADDDAPPRRTEHRRGLLDRDRNDTWDDDRSSPDDSAPNRSDTAADTRPISGGPLPSRTEKWGSDREMPSDSVRDRNESRDEEPKKRDDDQKKRDDPSRSPPPRDADADE